MKNVLMMGAMSLLALSALAEAKIERLFREPRHFRGNTNVHQLSPLDGTCWLWHPADAVRSGDFELDAKIRKEHGDALPVMVFENEFEVKAGDETLEIDVSADERFYLTVDGEFIARGPNRADVENWQFQSYRLTLAPGQHVMRAVVTRLGRFAPLAQLSWRGGFALRASGKYDKTLSTRRGAPWKVAWWKGMKPAGVNGGAWGTGSQFELTGSGPYAVEVAAADWVEPVTVRGTAGNNGFGGYGSRTVGWLAYPSQLPDQTELEVRPGEFRAATHVAEWRATHAYSAEETRAPEVAAFNALLHKGKAVTVPAHTRLQLAWHLGRYLCAYPRVRTAGGQGARLSLSWTECPRDEKSKLKGHRGEIIGKYLDAFGDTYVTT